MKNRVQHLILAAAAFAVALIMSGTVYAAPLPGTFQMVNRDGADNGRPHVMVGARVTVNQIVSAFGVMYRSATGQELTWQKIQAANPRTTIPVCNIPGDGPMWRGRGDTSVWEGCPEKHQSIALVAGPSGVLVIPMEQIETHAEKLKRLEAQDLCFKSAECLAERIKKLGAKPPEPAVREPAPSPEPEAETSEPASPAPSASAPIPQPGDAENVEPAAVLTRPGLGTSSWLGILGLTLVLGLVFGNVRGVRKGERAEQTRIQKWIDQGVLLPQGNFYQQNNTYIQMEWQGAGAKLPVPNIPSKRKGRRGKAGEISPEDAKRHAELARARNEKEFALKELGQTNHDLETERQRAHYLEGKLQAAQTAIRAGEEEIAELKAAVEAEKVNNRFASDVSAFPPDDEETTVDTDKLLKVLEDRHEQERQALLQEIARLEGERASLEDTLQDCNNARQDAEAGLAQAREYLRRQDLYTGRIRYEHKQLLEDGRPPTTDPSPDPEDPGGDLLAVGLRRLLRSLGAHGMEKPVVVDWEMYSQIDLLMHLSAVPAKALEPRFDESDRILLSGTPMTVSWVLMQLQNAGVPAEKRATSDSGPAW